MNDDADSFDAPKCPQCFVRLTVGGTAEHPYLICPVCRTAYLNQVWIT